MKTTWFREIVWHYLLKIKDFLYSGRFDILFCEKKNLYLYEEKERHLDFEINWIFFWLSVKQHQQQQQKTLKEKNVSIFVFVAY